jgi:fumarate hydratase class I
MFTKSSHKLMKLNNLISGRHNRLFSSSKQASNVKPFYYQELFEHANELNTPFKKLTGDFVSTIDANGEKILDVKPQALTLLAEQAMIDIAHLLRPAHLQIQNRLQMINLLL